MKVLVDNPEQISQAHNLISCPHVTKTTEGFIFPDNTSMDLIYDLFYGHEIPVSIIRRKEYFVNDLNWN